MQSGFKIVDQEKGNKAELSNFLSRGKQNVIEYKTYIQNSKTYVRFIWCECCAQKKDVI